MPTPYLAPGNLLRLGILLEQRRRERQADDHRFAWLDAQQALEGADRDPDAAPSAPAPIVGWIVTRRVSFAADLGGQGSFERGHIIDDPGLARAISDAGQAELLRPLTAPQLEHMRSSVPEANAWGVCALEGLHG